MCATRCSDFSIRTMTGTGFYEREFQSLGKGGAGARGKNAGADCRCDHRHDGGTGRSGLGAGCIRFRTCRDPVYPYEHCRIAGSKR